MNGTAQIARKTYEPIVKVFLHVQRNAPGCARPPLYTSIAVQGSGRFPAARNPGPANPARSKLVTNWPRLYFIVNCQSGRFDRGRNTPLTLQIDSTDSPECPARTAWQCFAGQGYEEFRPNRDGARRHGEHHCGG